MCYDHFSPPTITTRKRAIGNAITVEFTDGLTLWRGCRGEYPIGHARRRADGIPEAYQDLELTSARQFPTRQQQRTFWMSPTASPGKQR
ncbi:hypothetical protein KCP76_15595 [Salmonella enterica subsp. enterica serovar Weltevreden]|nr:hypothetical protein KCP76_15595 [Salmonella enterica subsp. enterica serovar Weltevreden]